MKRLNLFNILLNITHALVVLLAIEPLVKAVVRAYIPAAIDTDTTRWQELTDVVAEQVSAMQSPNKNGLSQKIAAVYLQAARSNEPFDDVVTDVRQQTRAILGFDGVEPIDQEFAFEWQQLFGPDGAIMKWLSDSGTQITDKNQRRFFMAVARGLQQQSKPVKEATILL